jgi:hypothetical protein
VITRLEQRKGTNKASTRIFLQLLRSETLPYCIQNSWAHWNTEHFYLFLFINQLICSHLRVYLGMGICISFTALLIYLIIYFCIWIFVLIYLFIHSYSFLYMYFVFIYIYIIYSYLLTWSYLFLHIVLCIYSYTYLFALICYCLWIYIQCVPLAGSPGKFWFTKGTKVQYIWMSCL